MPLTRDEAGSLFDAIAETRDDEIGCDTCLAHVAAYAEQALAGLAPNDAARRVREHLAVCPECREEYEALLRALDAESR